MNVILLAIFSLSRDHFRSILVMNESMTDAACSVSSRVGWYALFAISAPRTST